MCVCICVSKRTLKTLRVAPSQMPICLYVCKAFVFEVMVNIVKYPVPQYLLPYFEVPRTLSQQRDEKTAAKLGWFDAFDLKTLSYKVVLTRVHYCSHGRM